MLNHEQGAWADHRKRVGGIDEAGRGPLAGPVVAACVCFNRFHFLEGVPAEFADLNDSKLLTAPRREELFALLLMHPAVEYGVGLASAAEIDGGDILRATILAMNRAVRALAAAPDFLLVDGRPVRPLPCASQAIVQGDRQSLSIAAASILAKVTRDRIMDALDTHYPGYGFSEHKGYGTASHLEALRRRGPCPIHRRSFKPIYDLRQGELFT